MTDFNDFDLDLKKVSSNGSDGPSTRWTSGAACWLTWNTIKLSYNYCESNQAPTTGMTRGCCRSAAGDQPDAIARCN